MTSNEELCVRAKSGEPAALWELWEQNRGLTRMKARQVLRALDSWGRGDVELSDLEQSAWFALERAARDFDPAAGFKFTTYYSKHLKTAFAEATGSRTERSKKDPVHSAISLEAPVSGDDGETEFGSFIADPRDDIAAADEAIYNQWLRERVGELVGALPHLERRVIRCRYYGNFSQEQTGAACGLTRSEAAKAERRALATMSRQGMRLPWLREWLDEHTDFYRGGPDPVSENVLWRETLEERLAGQSGRKA